MSDTHSDTSSDTGWVNNNYISDSDSEYSVQDPNTSTVQNHGNNQYVVYLNEQHKVNDFIDLHRSIVAYIHDHESSVYSPNEIIQTLKEILCIPFGENESDDNAHIVRPLQDQFEPKFDSIRELVGQSQDSETLWNLIYPFYNKYFEVIDHLQYDSSMNMTVRQWKDVWNEYI